MSLPIMRRVTCSRSGRRLCLDVGAAAQRHRRQHQVVERRCCAGALRLHHCGFGCRCQLCLQDTHWLHFSVFCGRSSQPRGFYDAFATARAGCSAGRVAAPPEGTARAEVFCAFHFIGELSVAAAAYLSSQVRALHANWQDT